MEGGFVPLLLEEGFGMVWRVRRMWRRLEAVEVARVGWSGGT